jgi:dipeptidyl aminopeptidase/acylaminoacyl peptidase
MSFSVQLWFKPQTAIKLCVGVQICLGLTLLAPSASRVYAETNNLPACGCADGCGGSPPHSLQEVAPDETTNSEENTQFPRGKVFSREYEFTEADQKMRYYMYLPKSFNQKSKYPLIIALHGLNSNPRQILAYPGFVQHAEEEGYIVVAPMGYNSRGWYGSRGTGGGRENDPKNLGELSEKDVMNVLNITLEEFPIDRDRIYLCGHSMGGGGSLHLAIKHPDIWAAIAPVAPAIWGKTSRLSSAKSIPAIVIQGDKDSLVSVRGTRRWIEEMKSLGMKHRYIEEKGGGHVMVAFNYFDEIFEFFAENPKSAREKTLQPSSPMDAPKDSEAKPSEAKLPEAQQDDN